MKLSRILIALLAVALIAAACAPAPTPAPTAAPPTAAPAATNAPAPTTAPVATSAPAPTAAPAPTTAPTTAAAAGGTLIGAFDGGPGGAPQSRPYDNSAGNTWLLKIFTPLVSLNKDSTGLEPQLATKWSSNADATQWMFNLRPNVKWHDGQAFTATDVKFSIELACNPAFGFRYDQGICNNVAGVKDFAAGTAKEITGVKIVDPATVTFTLVTTDPKFPYKTLWAYILPQHALKDQDPAKLAKSDWFLNTPIGTGPFKIFKYVKDQYMDLVPNPYYWNGAPKLGHLINQYFTDDAAADIALEKGSIQFAYIGGDVAARLKTTQGYTVFEGSSFTPNYISFNLRDKRLQDVRVRQAVMYAIDRKSIIKDIWKDTAYAVPCMLPQKDFWPSDVNNYDYNPAKAQQLLKDAGWSSSNDTLEFWTYYNTQQQKDALQAMQQYLAQVGIKVNPKIMDVPAYNAAFYTGEGWQFSYRGYGVPTGQSPRLALLDSTQTNDKKSWEGNTDPTLATLLNKAEQSLVDADYTKGMQAVCKYLNDYLPNAPMWVGIRYGAMTSKVKSFYYYPAPAGGPYEDHPELWDVSQ